jgi:hypothetical protein
MGSLANVALSGHEQRLNTLEKTGAVGQCQSLQVSTNERMFTSLRTKGPRYRCTGLRDVEHAGARETPTILTLARAVLQVQ